MNIQIKNNTNNFLGEADFELVERKGIGHPDTMCDAIAECASRNYIKYCMEHFERPAHHWFDKVMLIGGEANVDYGVGEIIKPYTLIFAGKVCYFVGKDKIPVDKILFESASEVLKNVLTGFIPEKHIKILNMLVDYQGAGRENIRYQPRNVEELPVLGDSALVSNDSNFLNAFAPLTILESVVLEAERYINGKIFKTQNPDTGWDVKLFGRRINDRIELLINMPFLAKYILSMDEYYKRKEEVKNDIYNYLIDKFSVEIVIDMNATDRNGRPYLTALGSVADTGDVGVVGRGNRINGLITPMRPMSIEAPAGKNPIDHTGKLYGVLAEKLANRIYKVIHLPVDIHIYTAKETQLDKPDEIIVKICNWQENEKEKKIIEAIIQEELCLVGNISREIIYKNIEMW